MRQKGFTLIELLIVISIAAITLTVAIPGMNSFIAGNRQAGAVNDFLSTLYLARDEALTRNLPVTICASSSGAACDAVGWQEGRLVFVDTDRDAVLDADETVIEQAEALPGSLQITSSEFPSFLTYRPNGRVMTADPGSNRGSFRFCANRVDTRASVATIGLTGRPESKRLTGTAAQSICGA